MAAQPTPQPQTSSSGQQEQGGAQQAVQQFTELAKQVQQLAQQYPEFVESAAQILPLIQKGMVRIAGNAQRTPERQAPPVG